MIYMKKCLKCGSNIEDESRFCQYCGYELTADFNEFPNIICKEKRMEISLLLAIFLPGISYFYLGLFKRGILYLLSFMILFLVLAIKSGFYTNISQINTQVLAILYIIVGLCIYVYQIIDVIEKTKMINNKYIRFLK